MRDEEDALSPKHRRLLFWTVCIPIRLGLAVIAILIGVYAPRLLPLVAVYATITAAGFLWNALLTLAGRKRFGGFGGRVWWSRSRWVHIVLWASAAVAAAFRAPWAGAFLAADALVGILTRLAHFG